MRSRLLRIRLTSLMPRDAIEQAEHLPLRALFAAGEMTGEQQDRGGN